MLRLIYETENLVNGNLYRGKHNCENGHAFCDYLGSGLVIKQAIERHGRDNFRRRTIRVCSTDEELNRAEAKFVNKEWVMRPDTYNLIEGGLGAYVKTLPQETRAKIAAKLKGRKHTPEAIEKIRAASTGRRHSDATKAKLRAINLGHPVSQSTREAVRRAATGRPQSAETRAKRSASLKRFYATRAPKE